MALSIGVVALLSWWLLPVGLGAAVLLGATLSPTDPVLAGDVQVGDPGEGRDDNVRFGLTGEAGLNDGLAFPFVHLALALLPAAAALGDRLGYWAWHDVAYRLVVGVGVGWLMGQGVRLADFRGAEVPEDRSHVVRFRGAGRHAGHLRRSPSY